MITRTGTEYKNMNKGKYTDVEIAFIYLNYKSMTDTQIAAELNRPEYNITNFRNRNRLLKPDVPNKGCFKKGVEVWNKGKKGYMGPNKTSFKKGQLPANTKHDLAISERRDSSGRVYQYIRIGLARWKLYHRHVWEHANGPIPKGFNVQFKDGNTLNTEISNLYLIDRQGQIKENSGPLHLPDKQVANYLATKARKIDQELKAELLKHPELLALARTIYHLKRTINHESNGKIKQDIG